MAKATAAQARTTISFATMFGRPLEAADIAELKDGADWLRTHDGKVEDWEVDANTVAMERIAILYLRAEMLRGNDFEYLVSVAGSVKHYGSISRGQARGVLNCMRAAVLRKDAAIADRRQAVQGTESVKLPVVGNLPRGIFTVSREDGSHRTYKINDWKPDCMAISLLVGQDNTGDYMGIAGLATDGSVRPWRSYRGDVAELKADIAALLDPAAASEAGKRYAQESGNCYRCNRVLTTPESIALGIGPVCAGKLD
jgi:hypothetical protein